LRKKIDFSDILVLICSLTSRCLVVIATTVVNPVTSLESAQRLAVGVAVAVVLAVVAVEVGP